MCRVILKKIDRPTILTAGDPKSLLKRVTVCDTVCVVSKSSRQRHSNLQLDLRHVGEIEGQGCAGLIRVSQRYGM